MRSSEAGGDAAAAAGPETASALRLCIAHEWLVAYAGSERCVEELLTAFPRADLLTTVMRPERIPSVLRRARPSLLQRIPGGPAHHEWLLPLMPLAWRLQRVPADVAAVVSSSHACAKAVPVPDGTPHLSYCHTPMRYAWDFASERARFPTALRPAARVAAAGLRRWDRGSARGVTRFVANSSAVRARIAAAYGRRAEVVHPPVRTDFFTPGGERQDHFLYVGRLVSYKRPDLVVEAFRDSPHRLVVVGDGHLAASLRRAAGDNVTFLSGVDDERLRELYRGARALVFPGEEDFGIVMAEAQACGLPVIGLAAGGALDIIQDGRTGWLLRDRSVETLRRAVTRATEEELDRDAIRQHALRFSAAAFRARMRAEVEAMVQDPRPA